MLLSKVLKKSTGWRCRTFVPAISAVILVCAPAHSQQAEGLRGQVAEDDINRTLLNRIPLEDRRTSLQRERVREPEETGFQPPDYEPVSEGAEVTATERRQDEAVSIFDLNRDNPFADEPVSSSRSRRRAAVASRDVGEPAAPRERIEAERFGTDTTSDDSNAAIITGTVRQDSIDALDESRNGAAQIVEERNSAIEGLDGGDGDDPYAALGMRLGTFIVYPELEIGRAHV